MLNINRDDLAFFVIVFELVFLVEVCNFVVDMWLICFEEWSRKNKFLLRFFEVVE